MEPFLGVFHKNTSTQGFVKGEEFSSHIVTFFSESLFVEPNQKLVIAQPIRSKYK